MLGGAAVSAATDKPSAARPWLLAFVAFLGPGFFILAPMALFLAYSLFSVEAGKIVYQPTIANYVRFFADPIFLPIFWRTVLLCLAVAVICVLLAYPVAYYLTRLQEAGGAMCCWCC